MRLVLVGVEFVFWRKFVFIKLYVCGYYVAESCDTNSAFFKGPGADLCNKKN